MTKPSPSSVPAADTVLPLLQNPADYVACYWDLRESDSRRTYWLDLFRSHFPSLLDEAVKESLARGLDEQDVRDRAEQARTQLNAYLDVLTAEPGKFGRLDIITLCHYREKVLRQAGFDDPYRLAKARENEAALKLLPTVLAEIDAIDDPIQRATRLVRGMFAGNIFDMGASQTAEIFKNQSVDFPGTLGKLKPRPWLIDDLDAWLDRVTRGPVHRHSLVFVDNAGPDIVLGMLPFVRDLLIRGGSVIVTANSTPTLNDVTHDEMVDLIYTIAGWDAPLRNAFKEQRLRLIPSGNGVPLIDMTRVSPTLVQAVEQTPMDLVVIEGMGRALESNLHVPFTCDTLKLAMIKDQGVAEALNGELYDLVLKFEPAG